MPNVLIVEDHPEVREMIRTILESHGVFVFPAADAAAALAAVDHAHFDAVIVDVQLPRMSGLDLVRELRRRQHGRDRQLPICVMSGISDPDVWNAATPAGADATLEKPFSNADLIAQVQKLCALSESAELCAALA